MFRKLTALLLLMVPGIVAAQITVTDADINAGDNVVWTANNTYILDGIVFVEEGATLTIEPGTVIQGELGDGNEASALVIARGAKIFAEGTPTNPIIFTSVLDDVNDPNDTTFEDRGLWGGVVILGRATTNNPTTGGEKEIEGVNEIVGEGDTRATYGGDDDNDSSGILRYVSIRHTGINVGDQAGNEIQGLTLGGVGAGTVIEYVESFASADDGFEWFGGTVNTKYLVSAFNEDDSFDWDEGFRGKGQFWFAIQATDVAGRAAEQDGATGNEFFTPYAQPMISNATYIGPGVPSTAAGDGAEMLIFRDNTGGFYYNSIFTEYDAASGGAGITVEDIDNAGDKPEDSRQRLEAGDLALVNNLWWSFGDGNDLASIAPQDFVQTHLAANGNQIADPQLRGVSRTPNGVLDPRPGTGSPAFSMGKTSVVPDDPFFLPTDYVGAFGVSNWIQDWTSLAEAGYVSTGIEDEYLVDAEIPQKYGLEQNYPNPFNPSTTIEFSLDKAQRVRLAVYDMVGREVAVLADQSRAAAGLYRVSFDASGLASGVYLYKLELETGSITRKMALLK